MSLIPVSPQGMLSACSLRSSSLSVNPGHDWTSDALGLQRMCLAVHQRCVCAAGMIAPLQQRQEPHQWACQVSGERCHVVPRQRWSPYEHPQMIPWTPPTMHLRLNFGRPRWHARQARRVLTWPAPSKTPRCLEGASPWPCQRACRAARRALTRRTSWTRMRSISVTMSRTGLTRRSLSQVRGLFVLSMFTLMQGGNAVVDVSKRLLFQACSKALRSCNGHGSVNRSSYSCSLTHALKPAYDMMSLMCRTRNGFHTLAPPHNHLASG